ncbi:hypothetical protein LK994_01815 [Ferruginibacter lapsinanis]|uniref:hypothetical protein n=1 Tax=Ferruginibacter lapsinanis TaxID=563172 RepID=UPI001E55EA90|nr:hypothetical protein [Ferruginibacter lapsinanis]UEG50210.1 hypothetical protein LK994_01815 [Ferruginibacter lapsinanis]
MIRKNLHFVLMIAGLAFCNIASAQLYIDNAQFFIQSGATVTVQGNVTSNADIQGTGKLQLKGSSIQTVSMAGKKIPNLEIDNVSNATLSTSAEVVGDLLFTNGHLILGSNNLSIGSAGTITTPTIAKHVVTDGTGKLRKAALAAAFTFPVGNSTTTYNPVSITNSGTADTIAVRCLANALTQGTTGVAYNKEVVDASWDISESVAGASNLSVTANWATSDQLAPFNAAKVGLSYYVTTPAGNVGWDLLNSQLGAAAAGTPNSSVTRTGITSLGTFAVGFRPVLSPLLTNTKIFLQGPQYTAGIMSNALATKSLIPTTEPYTGMTGTPAFTHAGSGGGETVANSAFFTTNNIVDWIFVELRDAGTGAVVSTRSALLKNDGSIVEPDVAGTGVTPLSMGGNAPGNYYISVRHRNHLAARSTAVIDYSAAKTTAKAYDFTTSLASAYSTGITNNALATVSTGVFGLWSINANSDRTSKKIGSSTTNDYSLFQTSVNSAASPGPTNVYVREDFNMDGNVRKTGASANTNDYTKLLGVLPGTTTTITQPTY